MAPFDPQRDQRLIELPSSSMTSPESPVPVEDASFILNEDVGIVVPMTDDDYEDEEEDEDDQETETPSISNVLDQAVDDNLEMEFPPYYPPTADMMEYTTVTTPRTPTLPIVSNLNSPVVTPPMGATVSENMPVSEAYFPVAIYGTGEMRVLPPPQIDNVETQWAAFPVVGRSSSSRSSSSWNETLGVATGGFGYQNTYTHDPRGRGGVKQEVVDSDGVVRSWITETALSNPTRIL